MCVCVCLCVCVCVCVCVHRMRERWLWEAEGGLRDGRNLGAAKLHPLCDVSQLETIS